MSANGNKLMNANSNQKSVVIDSESLTMKKSNNSTSKEEDNVSANIIFPTDPNSAAAKKRISPSSSTSNANKADCATSISASMSNQEQNKI